MKGKPKTGWFRFADGNIREHTLPSILCDSITPAEVSPLLARPPSTVTEQGGKREAI